jgi:glycosyltransferase involved in cell wall biosynthesis
MIENISILIPFRPVNDYRDRIFKWNIFRLNSMFPGIEICIEDSDPSQPFNLSAARNKAFSQSTKDNIFVLDADTVFNGDTLIGAMYFLDKYPNSWLFPYDYYYSLDKDSGEKVLNSNPETMLSPRDYTYDFIFNDPSSNPSYGPPLSGFIGMKRASYIAVGGFDESFKGWGFEDWAFMIDANHILGKYHRLRDNVFHIWHPINHHDTSGSNLYKINQERYNFYRNNYKAAREKKISSVK